LYLTRRQREALSNLRYGLTTYKGFTLLVGEAGTGKTTLLRTILGELADTPNRYVLVSNPTLGRSEFYEFLAREFSLSDEARTSKTRFLADLQVEAESRFISGGVTGLIIDEAQSLSDELLEEIRLLGNIETTTSKLLNIVLSGQPELAERLNQPSLRQLKQRIALRCEVGALTLEETAAYISGRIRIAGGTPQEVFTREAVVAVHEASAGIPRTINVLCDNALISGFASRVKPIAVDILKEVCRDFALDEPEGPGGGSDSHLVAPPKPRPQPASEVRRTDLESKPAQARSGRYEPAMFSSITPSRKRRFIFFGLLLSLSAVGELHLQEPTAPATVEHRMAG
jgi:general secretion pathway protein A